MSSLSTTRPMAGWLAGGLTALVGGLALLWHLSFAAMPSTPAAATPTPAPAKPDAYADLPTATFAAGCFWCVEAVLQRVDGVKEVTSGFTGGTVKNPTYEQVCTGTTGQAEAVEVKYDPKVISYEELLDWFWRLHDPTTLNRQGADEGTQYRSAIFYHDDAQKAAALKSLAEAQKHFKDKIVTQIVPAGAFYSAEQYHQDYYNQHPEGGYCQLVIAPKLDKLHLDTTSAAKKSPAEAPKKGVADQLTPTP